MEQPRSSIDRCIAVNFLSVCNLTILDFQRLWTPMLPHFADRKRVSFRVNPHEDNEHFGKLGPNLVPQGTQLPRSRYYPNLSS